MERKCNKCLIVKDMEKEFCVSRGSRNGYAAVCKQCQMSYNKNRYQDFKLSGPPRSPQSAKICSVCKTEKPICDYSKNCYGIDGYNYICKSCACLISKKRREKLHNREITEYPKVKTCFSCKTIKPSEDFYKCKNNRDGLDSTCKNCKTNYYLSKVHGIPLSWYDDTLAAQGGGCAICSESKNRIKNHRMALDHCHKTGKVRGILCHHCNTAIGFLQEDPEILQKAIEYLKYYSEDGTETKE